jgi:hypothetical protein
MKENCNLYTLEDLETPEKEPMVIIRKSLLWICGNDKYAAAVLNMYIHWARWIIEHHPELRTAAPTIYRKQADLINDLLDFCTVRRLRQANALLVKMGLLKISEVTKGNGWEHLLRYELQIDRLKELLQDWQAFCNQQALEKQDAMAEVALEADSSERENFPLREGKKTLPEGKKDRVERDNFPLRKGQFSHIIDNNPIDNLIDDGKEKRASASTEHSLPQNETAALAAAISLLKNFSQDQVQQILQALEYSNHLEEASPTESVIPLQQISEVLEEIPPAAPQQASVIEQASVVIEEEVNVNEEEVPEQPEEPIVLEKPAPKAPRLPETVLALIEYLRGERYTKEQRPRELRAASKLLTIKPDLSLTEIEEAWEHGSDDYWLEAYGEHVHVHDLVRKDSHDKYYVLAFLAHKRTQERYAANKSRYGVPYGSRSSRGRNGFVIDAKPAKPIKPEPPKPELSEEEAAALVEHIAQQAVEKGYTMHGTAEPQGDGWIVRVCWASPYWQKARTLPIHSFNQWTSTFRALDETLKNLQVLHDMRKEA